MLAAKAGKPLPTDRDERAATDRRRPAALAGRYRAGDRWFDLRESFGNLYVDTRPRRARILRLRKSGKDLIVDDVAVAGGRTSFDGGEHARARQNDVTRRRSRRLTPPPDAAREVARG